MEKPLDKTQSRVMLLAIAYLGFISLGLPDPLAGVAWPSVRDNVFSATERFLVPSSSALVAATAPLASSEESSPTLWDFATSSGSAAALWSSRMFGSGLAPVWPIFVACAVVWGLGSGGIDAGLNAYVSNHLSQPSCELVARLLQPRCQHWVR